MKFEVGMYIRIEKGIYKINYFINNNYTQKFTYIDNKGVSNILEEKEIIKASHNIIDLIEEDDLIKCQFVEQTLILQVGARYTNLYPENGFVKGVFTPDNEFLSLEVLVEEDILQSILTKEQFESISYEVK